MNEFAKLGLSDDLLRAVVEAGYSQPTPIQEKAIPPILMNKDILGCAQTGTGKTASFVLPLLDILAEGRSKARMPRAVILTPTRELAAQIANNFNIYGKYHSLEMALLIGGVAFGEQEQALTRSVDVLIATPGRLLDHIERGNVMLGNVQILVIDEADRMLDMGFIPDIERLIQKMPTSKQNLLFSATMPAEIRKLANRFLHNPREVTVAPPSSTNHSIEQSLIELSSPKDKLSSLMDWLDKDDYNNALVFCNRKRDVEQVARTLQKQGFAASALHGDMNQYKRLECLESFKQGEVDLLICSDVAARGLDIPAVSHVYNYDVPTQAEDYVHRIGRTGRAGRHGVARMLYTPLDEKYLQAIESMIGKAIPALNPPTPAKAKKSATSTKSSGRAKAKTPKPPFTKANLHDGEETHGQEHDERPFGQTDFVPAFLK